MKDRLQMEFEEVQTELGVALGQRVMLDHFINDLLKRREDIRAQAKRERRVKA